MKLRTSWQLGLGICGNRVLYQFFHSIYKSSSQFLITSFTQLLSSFLQVITPKSQLLALFRSRFFQFLEVSTIFPFVRSRFFPRSGFPHIVEPSEQTYRKKSKDNRRIQCLNVDLQTAGLNCTPMWPGSRESCSHSVLVLIFGWLVAMTKSAWHWEGTIIRKRWDMKQLESILRDVPSGKSIALPKNQSPVPSQIHSPISSSSQDLFSSILK